MRHSRVVALGLFTCLAAAVVAAPGPITFREPVPLAGTPNSMVLTAFDATGDGKDDVVLAPYYQTGLRIFPSNGDGTFGAATTVPTTTRYNFMIAHGRLDADDVDDVVICDGSAGGTEVLLSGGEDGWESTTYGASPAALEYPTLIDLDVDGDLDLFTTSSGSQFFRRLNDGTGHFGAATIFQVSTDQARPSSHAVAADFDQDGRVDLAIASPTLVTVYWRKADSTFETGPAFVLAATRGTLSVSDVDRDGLPDLVFASGSSVIVVRHTAARAFATPTAMSTGWDNTWSICTADLDRDGYPEIVAPTALFPNAGNGTFGAPRALPSLFSSSTAAGDFDGDGFREFARNVHIIAGGTAAAQALFVGEAEVEPAITAITPDRLFLGTEADVTITGSNLSDAAFADFGADVALTNFRVVSDTQVTLHVAVGATAASGPRQIRVVDTFGGEGAGTFTAVLGGRALIASVRPDHARAGETLDVVVEGDAFVDPVGFALGAGITIHSQSRDTSRLVRLNVTVAPTAAPGPRDLVVTNGTGLVSEATSAFTVTPVLSLDVTQQQGKLRLGRTPAKSGVQVTGTIAFNAFSPDATFNPAVESATVRIGNPAQAFELLIPPDLGWTIRGERVEWRTAKLSAGPKVRLVLDFAKRTFSLVVDRADVALGDPSDFLVEFDLGNEPGASLRRWAPVRRGFVLR